MKRMAIAFCLLLFLALPVNAQEYDYCAGAGGAAAGTGCQTGTYLFTWQGDYSIGGADTDKACFTNGTVTKDGTVEGSGALSVDYGESSSIGFRYTADGDAIKWALLSRDGFLPTTGTIYVRMKALATTATMYVVDIYKDGNNSLAVKVINSNEVQCVHMGNGTATSAYGGTITDDTWTTIGCTWQPNTTGNDFGVYNGVSWSESDKGTVTDWSADADYIYIGANAITGGADDFYVNAVVITNAYKSAIPDWWP